MFPLGRLLWQGAERAIMQNTLGQQLLADLDGIALPTPPNLPDLQPGSPLPDLEAWKSAYLSWKPGPLSRCLACLLNC